MPKKKLFFYQNFSDNAGAPLDFVPFNQSLKLPNCKELLGRKIRLLWTQETDTEVYFRIQVHMDSSQYAAIGEIVIIIYFVKFNFKNFFWPPLVKFSQNN